MIWRCLLLFVLFCFFYSYPEVVHEEVIDAAHMPIDAAQVKPAKEAAGEVPVAVDPAQAEARNDFIKKELEKNVEKKEKTYGILHEKYLSEGDLDAVLITKGLFKRMDPLDINEALRDIRRFVESYVSTAVRNHIEKIGEKFLTDILHVYGHVINFIDDAWVDRKSKGVRLVEGQDWVPHADPIRDYWWYEEHMGGVRLHSYKFYASCLDYLTIMTRAYFLFPCHGYSQWSEMDSRWLWWLEKVTVKLSDSERFGGYYQENVKLFKGVYSLWKDDFEKKQKKSRKRMSAG